MIPQALPIFLISLTVPCGLSLVSIVIPRCSNTVLNSVYLYVSIVILTTA